jgi:hypothetical protein
VTFPNAGAADRASISTDIRTTRRSWMQPSRIHHVG